MTKQYNVLEATPTGGIWTSQQAPGKSFQSFFLKLEGVEKSVLINRMAGSPLLSGPAWLELTETPSKNKPGSTYYKAKVQKAPENASELVQQSLPLGRPEGPITWGAALNAAATWLTTQPELAKAGIPALKSVATDLYMMEPPDREGLAKAKEAAADILPAEEDLQGDIDLSEIPF